jgi:hypothetical protein
VLGRAPYVIGLDVGRIDGDGTIAAWYGDCYIEPPGGGGGEGSLGYLLQMSPSAPRHIWTPDGFYRR